MVLVFEAIQYSWYVANRTDFQLLLQTVLLKVVNYFSYTPARVGERCCHLER